MYLKKYYNNKFLGIFFSCGIILISPINCSNQEKNLELAYLDERSGNNTQALYRYELILKENPNNKLALKRMGMILSKNPESWGVGIFHLENALEIDPEDEEIRRELFFLYLATENFNLATQSLSFWKSREQTELFQDLDALLNCEAGIGKISNHKKTVDGSPNIPEFWKKRCEANLSKQ